MADELEPCPFCGNDTVHVHDNYVGGSGFMVMCGSCTAEGPLCNTEGAAASEWNRRAAPIAAQLDQDERAAFEAEMPPPDVENINLTYAIAGKVAEFYPQETPRDMETNHRLARAIQRLPLLRQVVAPYAERIRLLERELERLRGDDKPAAWAVGLEVFMSQSEAQRNVRNPDLKPEPLYRRAQLPQSTPSALELVNAGALRQFRHNDGSDGFVFAYDKAITDRVFAALGRTAGTASDAAPADPMDWPLPCDIAVGNGTIRKGCKLRTLVTRMESLQRMAVAALPKLTPEQQRENWDELFAAAAPSPQENTNEN